MKIGCCLPGSPFTPRGQAVKESMAETLLAGYRTVKEAGYDYAESSVTALMNLSEEELTLLSEKREAHEFELEACNCFLPGTFQLSDPAQLPKAAEYAEEALRRMRRLGAKVVVFGSGAARRLPGVRVAAELASIDAFLRVCEEKAAPNDITVVIEPLNKSECNLFNSVNEAASACRRLNLPHVKLLADAYHMYLENDPLRALEENADILRHIHVAEVPDRTYPGKDGGAYLRDFAAHLKDAVYTGRVTIECGFNDFIKEIRLAYPLMAELFR